MTLSFRNSLMFLLGLSLLITVVIGGIGGYFMMKNANNIAFQHNNITRPALDMETAKANAWMAHALMLQMALDKDPVLIDANYRTALSLFRKNSGLISRYRAASASFEQDEALLADFEASRKRYRDLLDRAFELDLATLDDQAIAVFNRFNNDVLLPNFYNAINALDALNQHNLKAAEEASGANARTSLAALGIIVAIIAASIVILLATGYYLASRTLRAVNTVTDFASALAARDFHTGKLDPELLSRQDEFGLMARALDGMQTNLIDLIDRLHDTAQRLAASTETAQRANESKSRFLARMSHEIRTPLNAIIGMTYIAKNAKDPATVRDSLDKITTSSSHLLGIINDILDISKIEAGKFELAEEEFDLEKLLLNVSTVVSVKTDEKEQDLLVAIDKDLPRRFTGDSLRLSQVLTNILNNAAKFTPNKGVIRLAASRAGGDSLSSLVRFTVEDTGIGLTEEQISRLFLPFEQADCATSRHFGGTGLGLAICDRIVSLMGGDIRVESEYGHGSRFIITVRLKNSLCPEPAADRDLPAAAKPPDAPPPSLAGRRLLLVEDVDVNREIVFAYLEGTGMIIEVAENGAEAVEKYLANHEACDIILMDIHMPVMDGYTAARRIREEEKERGWRRTPILAMTANAFREDVERCLQAGMDSHVAKPMDPGETLRALEKHLDSDE